MSEQEKIPEPEIPTSEQQESSGLTTQPETSKSETPNMEVHKHPHHVTHKKKLGEYFLEFAMIFFAVFLGFVAENIRERTVENRREKEYMESMVEDLKSDTAKVTAYIRSRSDKVGMMDSLATLLVSDGNKSYGNEIYYYARYVTVAFPLITSDGTLQQLKNSGGLRLIRKQKIVDSILKYDANVKYIQYLTSKTEDIENTFREMAGELFDAGYFNYSYGSISKKITGNPWMV